MNKETATKRGFQFCGIYERSEFDAKIRLEEIRKQGYKTLLVTVPDDPRCAGGRGRGYSVYVEKSYLMDHRAASIRASIKLHKNSVLMENTRHQERMNELNDELARNMKWLNDNGYPSV